MSIIRIIFTFFFIQLNAIEQVQYPFTDEPIDIVIPCHEKDQEVLKLCIEGIKQNGIHIGKIFIVSNTQFTNDANSDSRYFLSGETTSEEEIPKQPPSRWIVNADQQRDFSHEAVPSENNNGNCSDIKWFDEKQFPFTKEDIGKRICKNFSMGSHLAKYRVICWIYQQLLKFYAPFTIPGISSNVLILDADTIFLNPVDFMNEKQGACFNTIQQEYVHKGQLSYFKHMKKLVPELLPYHPLCDPICHHMLFQMPVLEDLFDIVETAHQKPFWMAFCDCFDWLNPRVSEYWIYFSFAMARSDQMSLCALKWENEGDINQLEEYRDLGYHFISYHHNHRKKS